MEIKSWKSQKMCHKKTLKFTGYNNSLRASQIENIINYLEKTKLDVDCLKKELIKNKRMLKTQKRFKSERHNAFTEEINKIDLSSNDDERMQSIIWSKILYARKKNLNNLV